MAIVPNSTLYLLRGCPLSLDRAHTLNFADRNTQQFYFSSLTYISALRYTYIRDERAIKVECNPAQAEQCNYLMFRNTSYLNRWFYAFITRVDYVNDNTAAVYFEMDNIQTWFMDCELMPCFVEREHTATDEIGENLIEDTLNYGEYLIRRRYTTFEELVPSIIVAATADSAGTATRGAMYSNVYSGVQFFKCATASAANDLIAGIVNKSSEQAIVAVFMAPGAFFNGGSAYRSVNVIVDRNYTDLDGYVPKNKKLFTYPYNFLIANNNVGGIADYRYEFFFRDDSLPIGQIYFSLGVDQSCNPTAVLAPVGYKEKDTRTANLMEKLILTGWPQCTYVTDTFKSYLALNATSDFVQSLTPWVSMGVRAAAGGPVGMAATAAQAVTNIMSLGSKYSAMLNMPPQAHGATPGSGMAAMNAMSFDIYQMTITAEFAKQIDEYWNVYGYPIHRVKVPEIKARPYWTYTKTQGCKVKGNVPAYAMQEIEKAFDNGITFWGRGDILGDYSLDNSPAGGDIT